MEKKVVPYKNSDKAKKEQVTEMFDTISSKYDRLNRIITFGIDIRWRKKLVKLVAETKPETLLDIATGTGDLAIALAKTGAAKIVGLDIAPGMLEVGKRKVSEEGLDHTIEMVIGDSEVLDYPANNFDAVTVAFGVRNFEDLEKGLSEIYRVLKPGGILAILETSVPTNAFYRAGYNFYGKFILPALGRWFSKEGSAYSYLSESAAAFPYGTTFNNILGKTGFIGMKHRPQTFGVATIYTATK